MEFETTYYKKYMQRICIPVTRENAASETEMVGASSDFQTEWQRDGEDWAENPQPRPKECVTFVTQCVNRDRNSGEQHKKCDKG